ncbi:MAG: nucleotide exchange factor GrpE [Elusimicrobiales bacterium]|nr:nucleotide exchange factor GrpE [Elusimicrobiales bacterium]
MTAKKEKDNNMEKISELKDKIEDLKEDIKECHKLNDSYEKELELYKKKADEYYDQLLRLKAEFENYRKRIEKEKQELIEWTKYDFILSLLPLVEMMKMAKSHIETQSDIENVKIGLSMIFNEFEKVFKNVGLSEIDVMGKVYDPMTCEIIGTVEGDDENDGKVVEIIQPGYIMNNRVIKPAKVRIAKKNKSSNDNLNIEEENKSNNEKKD